MTALGRQEAWEDSPEGYPQSRPYKWWNWHDSYVPDAAPDPKWVEVSDAGEAAFRKGRLTGSRALCSKAEDDALLGQARQITVDRKRNETRCRSARHHAEYNCT